MTWTVSGVVRVLLVPADSGRPMQLTDVASARFEELLGGRPQRIRPLVEAEPVSWMAFVGAGAQEAGIARNQRAQRLAGTIGGQPGRALYGPVLFTGRGPQDQIRGVPGIVNQMAALIGYVINAQE